MLTTVIPSVCEESFPIVLMLIGIEMHHHSNYWGLASCRVSWMSHG